MQQQLEAWPAGFHREVPQEEKPPRRWPGRTLRGGPFTFVSAFLLTSSRGLCKRTGLSAPKSGRDQAVPHLPSRLGARGQAVSTAPGPSNQPRLSRLCPAANPRGPASSSGQAGPRPPRPPRAAPGFATLSGPIRGAKHSNPCGGRPRTYLDARGSSSCCCHGRRAALAARTDGDPALELRTRRGAEARVHPNPAARRPPPPSHPPQRAPRPARPPGSARPWPEHGRGSLGTPREPTLPQRVQPRHGHHLQWVLLCTWRMCRRAGPDAVTPCTTEWNTAQSCTILTIINA
ncbi:uncharacterized protein ACIGJ3_022589 [Trichechus inunguis]